MKTNKILPDLLLSKIWDKIYKTEKSVTELESNLGGYSFFSNPEVVYINSNSTPYEDEKGNYIFSESDIGRELLSDSDTYTSNIVEGNFYRIEGADSAFPFSKGGDGEEYKSQIIGALASSGLNLTEDSTWEEICDKLLTRFPASYDILAEFAQSDWSVANIGHDKGSASWSYNQGSSISVSGLQGGYQGGYSVTSKTFDISSFNNLYITYSSTHDYSYVRLITEQGTITPVSGNNDISAYTGLASIYLQSLSKYRGSDKTPAYSTQSVTVTNIKLSN